jgi:TATA-binding protein-associated factor
MSAFTIKGFTEGFPEDMQVETSTFGQSIIDEFSIVRTLLPRLHPSLVEQLREMYGHVVTALQCRYSVIRFAAARCFATMCKVDLVAGMKYMVDNVLPMVTDQLDIKRRQGAIECIYRILSSNLWLISDLVTTLDTEILPYVIFLIVPVMGRMSDSDNDVRLLATETFATLVKLVPLEAGIPDPPGMSEEMLAERDEERKFIAQMLDGSKVEPFKIPVAIQADLRKYQQDGVNWLAFLNKYHLHGVLCDGTIPSILLPNFQTWVSARRCRLFVLLQATTISEPKDTRSLSSPKTDPFPHLLSVLQQSLATGNKKYPITPLSSKL